MTVMHGGDVWQGDDPSEYLDFSANLNPEGPPDWVRAAMAQGLERARYYPDPRGRAARAGMAAFLGLPEACVLPTSGGIEAAALVADFTQRAGEGARNVVAQPTFQEYGRLCGAYRNADREGLLRHAFSEGETLWLCNPNNPTGDALSRVGLLRLSDRAGAAGARLVVDEAFIGYCPEASVADRVASRPSLIVLGSLTKLLAIPGIRLGYLAAHPTVIEALERRLPPWRLNCAAEAVAAALPGHGDDFASIRALNEGRRARFCERLRALGIKVYPSRANFVMCDFGRDMRPAVEALLGKRILVRPCGMFPGLTHGHVRLCVRTDEENARLAEALRALLARGNNTL